MKLYRALLLFYPKSFRGDYGREIDAIFARRSKDARGSSRIALWFDAITSQKTRTFVPGTGHGTAGTEEGAAAIRRVLDEECVAR